MICPYCKSEIKDASKFCGNCGAKISAPSQLQSRTPTEPSPILQSNAGRQPNQSYSNKPNRGGNTLLRIVRIVFGAMFLIFAAGDLIMDLKVDSIRSPGFEAFIIVLFAYLGLRLLGVLDRVGRNKRLLVALAALVVMTALFSFSKPAGRTGSAAGTDSASAAETKTAAETAGQGARETKGAAVAENTTAAPAENATEAPARIADIGIEEAVIYEGNDVIIKAVGAENHLLSKEIKVYIENNSNLNLSFNARAYGVNGIMTGNSIYSMRCDVAAGKKANTSIEIQNSFLDFYGIKEIREISVLFWAYDNAKSMKEFDSGQTFIYTTAAGDDNRLSVSGSPKLDQNGFQVEYLGEIEGQYYFVVKNRSGEYAAFDVKGQTYNDFTSSEMDFNNSGVIVLDGYDAVISLKPGKKFMEDNGIETLDKIEFRLDIRPKEDYFKNFTTDVIMVDEL